MRDVLKIKRKLEELGGVWLREEGTLLLWRSGEITSDISGGRRKFTGSTKAAVKLTMLGY